MKSLLLAPLLVACGGGNGAPVAVDAAIALDGNHDAAPVSDGLPPHSARVSVEFFDNGPDAAATVFFLGVDSHVLATMATDSTGVVTGPVEDGGYVVVASNHDNVVLDVIADVHAGDELISGNIVLGPDLVMLDAPFDTGAPTANAIAVFSRCGALLLHRPGGQGDRATGSASLAPCSGTVDMTLVSVDINNVALRTASVTVQNVTDTITIPTATYTAPAPRAYQLAHVPADAAVAHVLAAFDAPGFTVSSAPATPAAGAAMVALALPAIAHPYFEQFQTTSNAGPTNTVLRWSQDATTANLAVDLGPDLLPDFATTPVYDATLGTLTWTETARGRTPTYSAAVFSSLSATVAIRAPYATGKIQLPKLPQYNGVDYTPPTQLLNIYTHSYASPLPWQTFREDSQHSLIDGDSGTASEIDFHQ